MRMADGGGERRSERRMTLGKFQSAYEYLMSKENVDRHFK